MLLTYSSLSRTVARKFSIGGLCSSAGGLCVCLGGLDIIKLTKAPLIYSVSRFNLGGLELCLGGKPTKVSGATGLSLCLNIMNADSITWEPVLHLRPRKGSEVRNH